jgi:hypothetical protein
MRLYKAAQTAAARRVIDHGFLGIPRWVYAEDDPDFNGLAEVVEYVEFRDMPPGGMTFSRTTETAVTDSDEDSIKVEVSGGPVLMDFVGDFVLCIEVPDELALQWEVKEDTPAGWPFREFWLTPDQANQYRDTLVVFDSNDEEEVRLDLVGK